MLVPACILFSVCLILAPVLSGAGVYIDIPGQLGFWLPGLIQIGFLTTTCFALFRCIFGRRFSISRFGPAALQLMTFALVFSVNIEARLTRWNFQTRMARRMEIVSMVEQGAIQAGARGPCDCFYAELPVGYKSVSAGHVILISHHSEGVSVTFFVNRYGLFPDDDYTAFIYRSGTGQPQTGVEDTERFNKVQKWANHWFFVEHT